MALKSKGKYSIPEHYEIVEQGNLKGLVRHGKETKTLLEPYYSFLEVARSYGVIYIASMLATRNDGIMITTYNQKVVLPIKCVDVIFGEGFIYAYVKKVGAETNGMGWYLINSELTGGKYVGDFEFIGRNKDMPHHIAVGKTSCAVRRKDGTEMMLNLLKGELAEVKKTAPRPTISPEEALRRENEALTEYLVEVDTEKCVVRFLNPRLRKVVKTSKRIGDFEKEVYQKYVLDVLLNVRYESDGRMMCDRKTGDLFVSVVYELENGFGVIAMITISRFIGNTRNNNEMLEKMKAELSTGFEVFKESADMRAFKCYATSEMLMTLTRTKERSITIGITAFDQDYENSGNESAMFIPYCVQQSGKEVIRVDVKNIELISEVADEESMSKMTMPYSVLTDKALIKDIHSHSYSKTILFGLTLGVNDTKGNDYDVRTIAIICKDFKYRSKKKVNGKLGAWATLNRDKLVVMP